MFNIVNRLAFFMGSHPRCGAHSPLLNLGSYMMRMIIQSFDNDGEPPTESDLRCLYTGRKMELKIKDGIFVSAVVHLPGIKNIVSFRPLSITDPSTIFDANLSKESIAEDALPLINDPPRGWSAEYVSDWSYSIISSHMRSLVIAPPTEDRMIYCIEETRNNGSLDTCISTRTTQGARTLFSMTNPVELFSEPLDSSQLEYLRVRNETIDALRSLLELLPLDIASFYLDLLNHYD